MTTRTAALALVDAAGRLDPAEGGHRHVHQDDVGSCGGDHVDALVAVGGLAHDLEALVGERPPEPLAQQAVVVDDHEPDPHGPRS